jgi:hypothetical protein
MMRPAHRNYSPRCKGSGKGRACDNWLRPPVVGEVVPVFLPHPAVAKIRLTGRQGTGGMILVIPSRRGLSPAGIITRSAVRLLGPGDQIQDRDPHRGFLSQQASGREARSCRPTLTR